MIHESTATFPCYDSVALIAFWEHEFDNHDLDYELQDETTIEGFAPFGSVRFEVRQDRARIKVTSDDIGTLYEIQSGIVEHLQEFAPDLEISAWSGTHAAGQYPPSLSFATVQSVSPLATSWLRVTLGVTAETLARYDAQDMHFSLVRSETSQTNPVWPTLNEKGTTDWPTGKDSLLSRAYTIRHVDAAQGHLVFDIFRHEGGLTYDWVRRKPLGEKVGLMGPNGGGVPRANWVLMAGDETAVPAIMRCLETMPPETRGEAILLVGQRNDRLPVPETGLNVRWLYRSEGDDLVAQVQSVKLPGRSDCALWFAASKAQARKVKAHAQGLGLTRKQLTCVAYWS